MTRALPASWEDLEGLDASYQAEGPDCVRVSHSGDECAPTDGDIAERLAYWHGGAWHPADGTFGDGNWSSADGEPDVTRLFEREAAS